MGVLQFIQEFWYALLLPAVLLGGLIYRWTTHRPFKGNVPPVGVLNDLPESVTGMKKEDGR